ncbi:hypothetical protein ACFQ7N_10700 [Streptomyces niveus]|uniref:hypothetical protein n=1 Tax=Streptomyces niveus TaxID=193462 RepID=UPI00367F802F
MRFHTTIEGTVNAEDPMWYTVIAGDDVEEYDGTSVQCGRDVLDLWIADQTSLADQDPPQLTDEHGNPYLRAVVRFSDDPDEHDNPVAIVGSDALEQDTSAELDAVDAAKDAKLYAKHLDRRADEQLEEALPDAKKAGHRSNFLVRRVAPAVSKTIALRLMNT